MALRETASYMLWRRNSARVAQCVTIGVVPPVVRTSGTVVVRRVRGKMVKFAVVQRKRKRVFRQEKETFAKEIKMTLARAQSLPVKYSCNKFDWIAVINLF